MAMRLLTLILLAGAVLAQAPAPQSIGTMSELMLDIIFPVSNEIFYVSRNEKKTEKDWFDLRQNALTLAESANVLMAENRARDKDRWMKDANLLREVGR